MGKKSHFFFAWIIESWWRFIHFLLSFVCVVYSIYKLLPNRLLFTRMNWSCAEKCPSSQHVVVSLLLHRQQFAQNKVFFSFLETFRMHSLQGKFCTVWAFPRVVYLKSQDAAATWESSLFWRDFLGKKQGHFWCEETSALAFHWRGRDWLISWRPLATTAGQLLQLHVLCFVFAEVTHTRLAWRADFGWVAQIA